MRRLTRREHQIALLVADGLADASIASQLGLSTKVVGNYIRHILDRLGLVDRSEITRWVTARRTPGDPHGRLRRLEIES